VSEELVQHLARNPKDQQKWLALFNKLRPAVYYSVYRACRGERDLAEELTQEVFVRFFKYADLRRFENDDHALAYLRQVARHQLVTYLRRLSSERLRAISLDEIGELVAPESSEDSSARTDLETLAAYLNPPDRLLLERLMAGDSVRMIADRLNLSYGAAAVRVHRLVRKMRSQFNNLGASR
jgi:RNA polymerase sigma factor (sigma-70 family)